MKSHYLKRFTALFLPLIALFLFAANQWVSAATGSVCAEVKIEIAQELSLERQGFDAHMRINNGGTGVSLDNVSITVNFTDAAGTAVVASSDSTSTTAKFFIRVDSMTGITDIAGNGSVAPSSSADIHWLIIPAPGAADNVPTGKLYYVGAQLSYSMGGQTQVITVTPDSIKVKPMPLLMLDYFLTQDVNADDPMTPEIEPEEPFTLGVRVKNNAVATAKSVKIDTAQPKIVENRQGLLIGFKIINSYLNDAAVSNTLLLSFGDIAGYSSKVGRWNMTASLAGKFTDFKAEFTHADELGGALTSLMQGTNAHLLIRDVKVDLPGRDNVRDFLAYDGSVIKVYESDSLDTAVVDQSATATLQSTGTTGSNINFNLNVPATLGAVYVKLPDPNNGAKEFKSIVRADGKRLLAENVWVSKKRNTSTNQWDYFLNMFDTNTPGGAYQLTMGDPANVPHPPALQFIPDRNVEEGKQVSFIVTASDPDGTTPSLSALALPVGAKFTDQGNGVAIFDWTPAAGQSGEYLLTVQASDGALQATRTAKILVSSKTQVAGPDIPVVKSPQVNTEVTMLPVHLEVLNSTNVNDRTSHYQFEVYRDVGMTQLASSAPSVAKTDVSTAWTATGLTENNWYYWRARAYDATPVANDNRTYVDGRAYGQWVYGRFFLNTSNDAPGSFNLSYPLNGTQLGTATPTLAVTNSVDPDGEPLNYAFQVYADASSQTLVTQGVMPEGASGVTSWTVDKPLINGSTYYWKVTAIDKAGSRTQSAIGHFTVNTAVAALPLPVVTAPLPGAVVTGNDVTITLADATQLYKVELDKVNTFDSPAKRQGTTVAGTPAALLTALDDNSRYYYRVSMVSADTASNWVVGSFMVSAANDAPAVPVAKNPGHGSWADTLQPTLEALPVVDAEGDALSYRFEVQSAAGAAVTQGLATQPLWRVDVALQDRVQYQWRVRAEDAQSAASAWSGWNAMFEGALANVAPRITLVDPAKDINPAAQTVTIRWESRDPDSDTTVALYYNTTASTTDGTLIANGLPLTAGATGGSYVWNVAALPQGTYHVYGVIMDSLNSAVHLAPGSITLGAPAVADTDSDGMPDLYEIALGFDVANPADAALDADGDGISNLNEYLQGTDPRVNQFTDPTYRWGAVLGGNLDDLGRAAAVDGQGNVYLTGHFSGSVDFDPTAGVDQHTAQGGKDIFVTKLNADGSYGWTATLGGSGDDAGRAIGIDASGHVYVAGLFHDTVDFDPTTGVALQAANGVTAGAFLLKLNGDGSYAWVRTISGSSDAWAAGVALDASGNVYISGAFTSAMDFGAGNPADVHSPVGGSDAFVTKLDTNGGYQWSRTFGGAANDEAVGVATTAEGGLYLAGYFNGTVDFDPTAAVNELTSAGSADAYLTKLAAVDGGYLWTRAFGGADNDYAYSVATDASGAAYVGGWFFGAMQVGAAAVATSAGDADGYLSRWNANGDFAWVRSFGGTGADKVIGLGVRGNNVYAAGSFSGAVDFNPGVAVDSRTANGVTDLFVARFRSDGYYGWSRTVGGASNDAAYTVAPSGSNIIYLTGTLTGQVDLDPTAGIDLHTGVGGTDAFVIKMADLEPNGVVVDAGATLTALEASSGPNPAVVGQTVTLNGSVAGGTGSSAPSGDLTFMDGAVVLGSGALSYNAADGKSYATFNTKALAVGTHNITAVYMGDAKNLGNTSAVMSEVVNRIASVTAFDVSSGPAATTVGQAVTLKAAVSGGMGSLAPTGTVAFMDGVNSLGTAALSYNAADGKAYATLQTTGISVGSHSIMAVYVGDTNNAASNSVAMSVTINAGGSSIVIDVSSGPNPAFAGDAVTLKAVVNGGVGILAPTGFVTFKAGVVTLGTATLTYNAATNKSVASLTTSSLLPGAYSVIAGYAGDLNNTSSSSAVWNQVIKVVSTSVNPAVLAPQSPFATGQLFATSSVDASPGLLKGDFDGDGKKDLVQIRDNNGKLSLMTYYGAADGFVAGTWVDTQQTYATVGGVSPNLIAADVDGDGKTDLVQPWNNSGVLYLNVYFATGDKVGAAFTNSGWINTTQSFVTGSGGPGLLVADINGDGKMDLVQQWNNGGLLSLNVYFSHGLGADATYMLTSGGWYATGQSYQSGVGLDPNLLVADVDGDGKSDLVQQARDANGVLSFNVYFATGSTASADMLVSSGWFNTGNNDGSSAVTNLSAIAADVDGDGKVDLVQQRNNGGVLWLDTYFASGSRTGASAFASNGGYNTLQQFATGENNVPALIVVDVNGDGREDLVQQWNNNGDLELYIHAATGSTASGSVFAGGGWIDTAQPYASALTNPGFVAADVNGDGKGDLIQQLNSAGQLLLKAYLGSSGINATTTMFDVATGPNPVESGKTLTIKVAVSGGSSVFAPTGSVTFKDGATTLGVVAVSYDAAVGKSFATYTTSALSVGAHTITAVYGGDVNNAASTSNVLAVTVNVPAAASTTTLGNGTDPGNVSLAPGGVATNAGAFSFQTSSGADTITAATVTLAAGTVAGLSLVEITNVTGTTVYGSMANPASDTAVISTAGITATTTLTEYRIRVTPKSHGNMSAPAGSSYGVTAYISSWAGTNTHAGSDTAGATVTIDNLSPANVTTAAVTATPLTQGANYVLLGWSNPTDSDLQSIVVLRSVGSAVADVPVEGATYAVGNTTGAAVVACVVSAPAAQCVDSGLTNTLSYNYKIFTRDSNGNYSATGVIPTGSPTTAKKTISGTVYADEGVTPIGSGRTIRLLINGVSVGTGITDASGNYSIAASLAAGNALLAYIDGDTVYKGTSVTISGGDSISGFNLYAGHIITRHDNAGSLSNANMGSAKGAYVDTDIEYSVSGGNLTVNGSSAMLYIPVGQSYTPGGNITTPHFTSAGTFNGGSGAVTVNGIFKQLGGTFTSTSGVFAVGRALSVDETIFTIVGGTFNHNNGTVQFAPNNGSSCGSHTYTISLTAPLTLYNVDVTAPSGGCNGAVAYVAVSGGSIIATNNFSHTDGNLQGAWEVRGNLSVGSSADGGNATIGFTGGNNQTYINSGGNEPDGNYTVNKTAGTVTLASALNLNAAGQSLTIVAGTLDIAGQNLTVNSILTVGAGGTLQLQGGEMITNTTKALNVGSTVIYNGAGTYASLAMGNTYHNLTFNGTGSWTPVGVLDVKGTLSIISGTLNR